MKNAKKADYEYKKAQECFPFGTGKIKRTVFHLKVRLLLRRCVYFFKFPNAIRPLSDDRIPIFLSYK